MDLDWCGDPKLLGRFNGGKAIIKLHCKKTIISLIVLPISIELAKIDRQTGRKADRQIDKRNEIKIICRLLQIIAGNDRKNVISKAADE